MKLLTRYVVREHVGPLLFALTALTSLLMLQYVARQLANLAGKGLPWNTIGEFFLLSLPFTLAMTLPMAVLVATLFAFGRMAAEHEITALKASGIRVRALMMPIVGCALLLSIGMVIFNDQVLPRANHRLRILTGDIAKTRPTLALRDQVLNKVQEQFYMRVSRSDAETNRMWDVVIYDLSKAPERTTIYADSGVFLLAANEQDLQLQLYDGHSQQFVKGDPKQFQRTFFREQTVQVRGIARSFEATASDSFKGDREMSICEMHRKYVGDAKEYRRIRQEYIGLAKQITNTGPRDVMVPGARPRREALSHFYCVTLPSLVLPKKATAATVGQQPAVPSASPQQPATRAIPDTFRIPASAVRSPDSLTIIRGAAQMQSVQLLEARESLDSLSVEIHKKFALSFACLVFVLFGPPIALRFPRGGVGVTLGVSLIVFGLYYVCLMGGEALADKGRLPAFVAMWIANVTFTAVGLLLLWRVESTTDRSRGGGLRDRWADRKARRALALQMRHERDDERAARQAVTA